MLTTTEVAPSEVAVLVLNYLQSGFPASARQFAQEADELLRLVRPPAPYEKVKGLHTLLNEYVALEARAQQRAAFERAFGDDREVRSCLSKLGDVMDHYLASSRRRAGPISAGTTSTSSASDPLGQGASSSSAAAHQASGRSAAAPRPPLGTASVAVAAPGVRAAGTCASGVGAHLLLTIITHPTPTPTPDPKQVRTACRPPPRTMHSSLHRQRLR